MHPVNKDQTKHNLVITITKWCGLCSFGYRFQKEDHGEMVGATACCINAEDTKKLNGAPDTELCPGEGKYKLVPITQDEDTIGVVSYDRVPEYRSNEGYNNKTFSERRCEVERGNVNVRVLSILREIHGEVIYYDSFFKV